MCHQESFLSVQRSVNILVHVVMGEKSAGLKERELRDIIFMLKKVAGVYFVIVRGSKIMCVLLND